VISFIKLLSEPIIQLDVGKFVTGLRKSTFISSFNH